MGHVGTGVVLEVVGVLGQPQLEARARRWFSALVRIIRLMLAWSVRQVNVCEHGVGLDCAEHAHTHLTLTVLLRTVVRIQRAVHEAQRHKLAVVGL